jgi:hypothetical protein
VGGGDVVAVVEVVVESGFVVEGETIGIVVVVLLVEVVVVASTML